MKIQFITLYLFLAINLLNAQTPTKFNFNGNKESSLTAIEVTALNTKTTASGRVIEGFSGLSIAYLKKGKVKKTLTYEKSKGAEFNFRGMELWKDDSNKENQAILFTKEMVYQFIRDDYNLISEINVYGNEQTAVDNAYKEVAGKIGFFIDNDITSDFHKQNIGKIAFFNDTQKQVTAMELGKDKLNFRVYTDSSLANKILGNLKKEQEAKDAKDGKKKKKDGVNIGKTIFHVGAFLLTGTDLSSSSSSSNGKRNEFVLNSGGNTRYNLMYVCQFDGKIVDTIYTKDYKESYEILQNLTTWQEQDLVGFDFFEKLDKSKKLSVGMHTLRIAAYLNYDGKIMELDEKATDFTSKVGEGEVKINVKPNAMRTYTLLNAEKYTKAFAGYMKDELGDAKFIADVTKKFNFKYNKNGRYEIKKVISSTDNYTYKKNEFGRVLRKQAPVYVYVKEKATGLCYVYYLEYAYEIDGVNYANVGEFWYTYTKYFDVDGKEVPVTTDYPVIIDCSIIK